MKVEWGIDRFKRQLTELSALTGITMAAAVTRTAALWVRDCIRATPPTGRGKAFTSKSAQRKLGERRLEVDVMKRAFPRLTALRMMQTENEGKAAIDALVRKGDYRGATETLRAMGVESEAVLARPNRGLHQRLRDKSTGRVRVPKGGQYLVADEGAQRAYLSEAMKRTGRAKSGWAIAAARLGLPKPGWGSHSAPGAFRGITDREKPSIEFGNGVPFIQSSGYANRIMKWTLNFRERAMRLEIERLWRIAQNSDSLAKLRQRWSAARSSREALE